METLSPPRPRSEAHLASSPEHTLIPDADAVREVLEEILASAPFCHTQQCKSLLCYVVKHTLAQEDHLLRERVIGAEVFGRPPDYETGDDPVVRIRVSEVRKRLAQFYQALPDAHPAMVQIEIPSGSYRAFFRWREGVKSAPEPQAPAPLPAPPAPALTLVEVLPAPAPVYAPQEQPAALPLPQTPMPRARSHWRWLAAAALLLLVAAAALIYALAPSAETLAFRRFWGPWTEKTGKAKAVIVSIGSNAVYRLNDDFTDRYAQEQNLQMRGMEFFVPTGPNTIIKGSDVEPMHDSFVALGDVAAVSALVATITRSGQIYQERFPNDISFAELHDTPSVLVGGFNNPMTMELTRSLPFILVARNEIRETAGGNRQWSLRASTDSHDTEDYAIITRLVQRNGDAPMMSVAGMGQYGTLAAANFICSPAAVAQLTGKLPAGWASRNLQVVLHVRVVDFKAAPPEIVAQRSW